MRYYFLFIFFIICSASLTCAAQNFSLPEDNCHCKQAIKSITIEGNRKTKTNVILREMSIKIGDTLSSDSLESVLQLNYQRLYNLNIFIDINLKVEIIEDSLLTIKVALKEQWFILPQADIQLADRNINVWWNEQNHDLSRVNLGLYAVHKNLTGRLDKLTLSTHFGYTQQLAVSYFRPYIDKQQKQGIGFGLGFSRSKELAFATAKNKLLFARQENNFLYNNFFANASWYYRPAYHMRHIVSLGFNSYKVGDTILQLNPDFFAEQSKQLQYAELAYRLEYNGVDNWNYPRKGLKIVSNIASRWGVKGMQYQALANIELGLFTRLPHRFLASFVFRGHTLFTDNQPYFLQAALGYKTNYVRGYEYYVAEANRFAIGRFSLKYEAVKHNFQNLPFRYLPKLPVWMYPKIFCDLGYASNPKILPSNTLANTFLYSFGVGLDIITAYDLKLRIEFAYNHLGENGLYLHANSE